MPEIHPWIVDLIQVSILTITICSLFLLVVSFLIVAIVKAADDV